MGFLIFAHIDGDHEAFTAKQHVPDRPGGLGFTDTARAGQHKNSDRPAPLTKSGFAAAQSLPYGTERRILPDDPFAEFFLEIEQVAEFVFNHPSERNTCPVGDNLGHGLRGDFRLDQRCFLL